VKYGADWIKFYADRRYFLKDGALHSWVNFTDEEMKAWSTRPTDSDVESPRMRWAGKGLMRRSALVLIHRTWIRLDEV